MAPNCAVCSYSQRFMWLSKVQADNFVPFILPPSKAPYTDYISGIVTVLWEIDKIENSDVLNYCQDILFSNFGNKIPVLIYQADL